MALQSTLCLVAITFYLLCKWDNAKRDRAQTEDVAAMTDEDLIASGLADATDKENPRFRYHG